MFGWGSRDEPVAFIDVKSSGNWSITIDEIISSPRFIPETGSIYQGAGSEVIIFQTTSATIVEFDCPTCDSNVQIKSFSASDWDSIENEIGDNGFNATYIIPRSNIVLMIEAHPESYGPMPPWTLTIQ